MSNYALYSLSISARATLDLHSLNNEGGEGNQIQTRMVNVVDQRGDLHNVNAISGDMFKHIQAEHLFNIAKNNAALPLCAGCREFNANRINADPKFQAYLAELEVYKDQKGKNKKRSKHSDTEVIDYLLNQCIIDDIEGILITSSGKTSDENSSEAEVENSDENTDSESATKKKRSLPRKSVVEFGWVVGIPEKVETDSYFHVKYVNADRSKTEASRADEEKRGSNLGQAIFHRPTSSGIYAAICHLELARIGFNDISQRYAIDEQQRALRAKALLESVLYTFLQPNGAMRSSQAPHIVNVEGVISLSAGATPAPTVSPLKDDYREQMGRLKDSLNKIAPNSAVDTLAFNSLSDLADLIGEIMANTTPFTLQYA